MKQKYFLVLALFGIILVSGCVQQGNNDQPGNTGSKISVPINISFTMSGTPALNQDVTLELYAKGWHPQEGLISSQIVLPENFELVSGDLSWINETPQQNEVHIVAKVKAIKTGTYNIMGTASILAGSKNEYLFVKVTKYSLTSEVSDKPFDSSGTSAQSQVIEEKSK